MSAHLLDHHHGHSGSFVHRLPAGLKLGVALALIVGTVLAPPGWTAWFVGVGSIVALGLVTSGVSMLHVGKRLACLSPFVLGVALANAFPSAGHTTALSVAVKSTLCLGTVILVSNTTPFSKALAVLRRVRVPALLITTIALMHRYLFVLADEAERMRRARLSRTFTPGRRFRWASLASVLGQLFVRASDRSERIYDAMCARGWK